MLRCPIILSLNTDIILYCNNNVIVSYSPVIVLLRIQLEAYCNCIQHKSYSWTALLQIVRYD